MKFSTRYKKFEDWLSTQDRNTSYVERIIRLHLLYPRASLDQLRGHAKATAGTLSKGTPKPVYARSWNTLSPREQLARERALEVLSHARRSGQSLSRLSREHKISAKAALRATNSFKKVRGRWKAKKNDNISRIMAINEDGKELFIEVTNSRYASIIGKYHSAIKEYLNTGNIYKIKHLCKIGVTMVGPVIISALGIVAFFVAALITPIISHILPKSRKPNKSEQLACGKILVGWVAASAHFYTSSNIEIPIIAGGIILLGTGLVELLYERINPATKNQIGRRKKGS